MDNFDYSLFKALVSNLSYFQEYALQKRIKSDGKEPVISEERDSSLDVFCAKEQEAIDRALAEAKKYPEKLGVPKKEERKIRDPSGKDITACMGLSIFQKLKNIEHWGENINLVAYHELKNGRRIMGARAVIDSYMDWCNWDEPHFYYELAHLNEEGKPREYARELALDKVVQQVFYQEKVPRRIESSPRHEELIKRAIEKGFKEHFLEKDVDFFQSTAHSTCIVQHPKFEIWKCGFEWPEIKFPPYQLLILAPKFVYCIGPEITGRILEKYLKGKKFLPTLVSQEDSSFSLPMPGSGWNEDFHWFNVGKLKC